MIEKAIVTYLNNLPALAAYKDKIYYHRVPTDAKMGWCYVQNAGGNGEKITKQLTQYYDTLLIYVEHNQQFAGRAMADSIKNALQYYRGDMGDARDIYITCETIRDLDGFFQTFRYLITCHVKYLIPVVANQH